MASQKSQKAGINSIEEVGVLIDFLQYKLDEISMFITTQVETERFHYERKCKLSNAYHSNTYFYSSNIGNK